MVVLVILTACDSLDEPDIRAVGSSILTDRFSAGCVPHARRASGMASLPAELCGVLCASGVVRGAGSVCV